MAVLNDWVTPLVLRSTHLGLHLTTLILIIYGIYELPKPSKRGKLLAAAHVRAVIWLFVELIFFILATIMLATSVTNSTLKKFPKAFTLVQKWFSENCPNYTFFYYVILSLFVLYGTMIGCNIPMLFNRVPIFAFPSPTNKPMKSWQFILIGAVIVGITNSILYFVAAFYPLGSAASADSEKADVDNTGKESNVQDSTDEIGDSVDNLSGTGGSERNTGITG